MRVLFVACMKSDIQPKRSCSIEYTSFNPSNVFTNVSMFEYNTVLHTIYMHRYVNSASQVLITMAQSGRSVFHRVFSGLLSRHTKCAIYSMCVVLFTKRTAMSSGSISITEHLWPHLLSGKLV